MLGAPGGEVQIHFIITVWVGKTAHQNRLISGHQVGFRQAQDGFKGAGIVENVSFLDELYMQCRIFRSARVNECLLKSGYSVWKLVLRYLKSCLVQAIQFLIGFF